MDRTKASTVVISIFILVIVLTFTGGQPSLQNEPDARDFERCIETDLSEIEGLKKQLFGVIDRDWGKNDIDVHFGLQEEDWQRLKILESKIPKGSKLKSKLVMAFRILVAAIYQVHNKLKRPKEQKGSAQLTDYHDSPTDVTSMPENNFYFEGSSGENVPFLNPDDEISLSSNQQNKPNISDRGGYISKNDSDSYSKEQVTEITEVHTSTINESLRNNNDMEDSNGPTKPLRVGAEKDEHNVYLNGKISNEITTKFGNKYLDLATDSDEVVGTSASTRLPVAAADSTLISTPNNSLVNLPFGTPNKFNKSTNYDKPTSNFDNNVIGENTGHRKLKTVPLGSNPNAKENQEIASEHGNINDKSRPSFVPSKSPNQEYDEENTDDLSSSNPKGLEKNVSAGFELDGNQSLEVLYEESQKVSSQISREGLVENTKTTTTQQSGGLQEDGSKVTEALPSRINDTTLNYSFTESTPANLNLMEKSSTFQLPLLTNSNEEYSKSTLFLQTSSTTGNSGIFEQGYITSLLSNTFGSFRLTSPQNSEINSTQISSKESVTKSFNEATATNFFIPTTVLYNNYNHKPKSEKSEGAATEGLSNIKSNQTLIKGSRLKDLLSVQDHQNSFEMELDPVYNKTTITINRSSNLTTQLSTEDLAMPTTNMADQDLEEKDSKLRVFLLSTPTILQSSEAYEDFSDESRLHDEEDEKDPFRHSETSTKTSLQSSQTNFANANLNTSKHFINQIKPEKESQQQYLIPQLPVGDSALTTTEEAVEIRTSHLSTPNDFVLEKANLKENNPSESIKKEEESTSYHSAADNDLITPISKTTSSKGEKKYTSTEELYESVKGSKTTQLEEIVTMTDPSIFNGVSSVANLSSTINTSSSLHYELVKKDSTATLQPSPTIRNGPTPNPPRATKESFRTFTLVFPKQFTNAPSNPSVAFLNIFKPHERYPFKPMTPNIRKACTTNKDCARIRSSESNENPSHEREINIINSQQDGNDASIKDGNRQLKYLLWNPNLAKMWKRRRPPNKILITSFKAKQ